MFDIGWTELLVIAVVAIIVVGPKDLPRMLRAFGQTVGKMRRMANEFQSTFNDALKEAEREADILDMKKTAEDAAKGIKDFDPLGDLKKTISQPVVPAAASEAATAPAPANGAAPAAAETAMPSQPASAGAVEAPATPAVAAPVVPAATPAPELVPEPVVAPSSETRS